MSPIEECTKHWEWEMYIARQSRKTWPAAKSLQLYSIKLRLPTWRPTHICATFTGIDISPGIYWSCFHYTHFRSIPEAALLSSLLHGEYTRLNLFFPKSCVILQGTGQVTGCMSDQEHLHTESDNFQNKTHPCRLLKKNIGLQGRIKKNKVARDLLSILKFSAMFQNGLAY